MVNFSESLLAHIRTEKLKFTPDLTKVDVVLETLKFFYHACVASERLLLDAAAHAKYEKLDSFDRVLHDYYFFHWGEERGEIVVLVEDLKAAGIDSSSLTPDPTAMAMIGTQYYLLKHVHPVCLLGYMAIMEADPTPIEMVEALEKMHGDHLFRFLRMHAVKDLEHRKELIALIDQAPQSHQSLISQSAGNALGYLEKFYGRW